MDDLRVVEEAARGVLTRPLSRYTPTRRCGVRAAAGFACVPEQDIARKFEVLLDSLAEVARKPARAARA